MNCRRRNNQNEVLAMHNGTQTLTHPQEEDESIALFFRRTAIGLNNISITFLILGKHKAALETLADAIEMIKHSIRGMCDAAEHRKDADKSIRRAMEALLSEDGLLTRNSNGTRLPYGPRRLHDIDLGEMD